MSEVALQYSKSKILKGPPGSRPSSSRMMTFGSVVDAAMMKKNGGKKKTVMSGDEVGNISVTRTPNIIARAR